MKDESKTEGAQLQRRKWWRRVKNFFVALSAFFCLAAMVAWGFGMAGWGFTSWPPEIGGYALTTKGCGGGLVIELQRLSNRRDYEFDLNLFTKESLTGDDEKKILTVLASNSWSNPAYGSATYQLLFPYWLLILLFALAPALWWRRRYIERRDEKMFEEAVAAKRAEQEKQSKR
jgi:predicted PurR-regulated permease PerM